MDQSFVGGPKSNSRISGNVEPSFSLMKDSDPVTQALWIVFLVVALVAFALFLTFLIIVLSMAPAPEGLTVFV